MYQLRYDDSIKRLVIFLTYRCNFNCSYCYVKKRKTKELSSKELIKIIDKLKKKNSKLKEINFMGGEPLLRFDTIKKIVSNYKNKFEYNLNTNGSLLNDDILNFLSKNRVIITLSLDGSEKTHNKNRKNKTFDKIVDRIRNYKDKVIINYVVNNDSTDKLIKDFDNLVKLGFKKIDIRPNSDYLWKKEEFKKLNKEILKFYMLYFNRYAGQGIKIILDKMVTEKCFYLNEKGCQEVKISPEGYFFSCCRLCNTYRSKGLNFGKNRLDSKKRKNFLNFARKKINKYRIEKCKDCILDKYCLCMIDSFYLDKKNFSRWLDTFCKINKIMIGNLLRAKYHTLRKF